MLKVLARHPSEVDARVENQFGISGLPETWTMPEKLHGTILYSFYSQLWVNLSFNFLSSAGPDWVDTVVEAGGVLCSRKGVNLPGCDLIGLQAVSERDEADLRFGVAQGVDIVFASFIRSAQDVKDVRRVLGPHGRDIKVISKVESRQGVQK